MTWFAPKLGKRIDLQLPIQTPNELTGALEETYTTIRTIWAEVTALSRYNMGVAIIRGQNTGQGVETHKITVRSAALAGLGKEQGTAFAGSFDSVDDLYAIKSNYFIFLRSGSENKGRRFKIRSAALDEARSEYVIIYAEEMEEVGTGWPK